jgi:hypothetical protein
MHAVAFYWLFYGVDRATGGLFITALNVHELPAAHRASIGSNPDTAVSLLRNSRFHAVCQLASPWICLKQGQSL